MKFVSLIFSILISILGLIISQFAYPFIASCFDTYPIMVSIIIGIIVFLLVCFITCQITKDSVVRRSIILPIFFSAFIASCIIGIRFVDGGTYYNGYLDDHNGLKNSLGITIISCRGGDWSKGIDEHGNPLFVSLECKKDWDYEEYGYHGEREYKYDIKIMWFDEYGNFINERHFEEYAEQGSKEYEKLNNYYYRYNLDDLKDIIESNTYIKVYQRIG